MFKCCYLQCYMCYKKQLICTIDFLLQKVLHRMSKSQQKVNHHYLSQNLLRKTKEMARSSTILCTCILHEENRPCFEEYTIKEKRMVIGNLNASTKYYVRVVASTKDGPGHYSENAGKFTILIKQQLVVLSGYCLQFMIRTSIPKE